MKNPNYLHPDKEDTQEDATTATRCFAMALGHLLTENEGIVIQLPVQEQYPDELHGSFIVYRYRGQIHMVANERELPDGQLIWMAWPAAEST